MTDTVTVPREPTPEMLDAAVNRAGYTEYGPLVPESLIPEIWGAMIAAAPKAEPKVIGMIGHVSKGKSELSGIVAALASAQPEAPKVEQEPETLRDRIAMAVTTGLLATAHYHRGSAGEWAEAAYRFADAMMEARK